MCIKELGKGSCIGELAIEGSQTAPYSIKTSSVVRVGQIAVTDLAGKTTVIWISTLTIPIFQY